MTALSLSQGLDIIRKKRFKQKNKTSFVNLMRLYRPIFIPFFAGLSSLLSILYPLLLSQSNRVCFTNYSVLDYLELTHQMQAMVFILLVHRFGLLL
jgi:hypothetical protein